MKELTISVLDRLTGGRGTKAIKYSMVSVVGIVITQAVLITAHGFIGLAELTSNVIAVSVAAGPVFVLNKRWVWRRTGPHHVRREVLPFWVFTLAGLVLSSLLVVFVARWTDSTIAVSAANISGFGLLWVAKFLFLDEVLFGEPDPVPADSVAAPPA